MLSDGVSEHQILKVFLEGMPPDPPRLNVHAVFAAFGGSAPHKQANVPTPMHGPYSERSRKRTSTLAIDQHT